MEEKKPEIGLKIVKFDMHKPPVFTESKKNDWIIYGNEKPFYNLYPQYLLNLYDKSNKHNALINGKIHFIAGNGFEIDLVGLNTEGISKLKDALQKNNKYGEGISEVGFKIASDFELFDGAHLEIIWNKAGNDFEFYHIPFEKLRRDKEQNGWWYSEDWAKPDNKQDKETTGLEFIPDFDIENPKGRQIYSLLNYRPGFKWYPKPNYIGSIPYAEIDYEIGNFHTNHIKTGFLCGTIITFFGEPTPEEQDKVIEDLKAKHSGTDGDGIVVIFTRDKDRAPIIARLSPDELDKQFEILNKTVQQELFVGHHIVNPILFGIKTEGQLGGRNEILESFELFKSIYIVPRQKKLNDYFNYLLKEKGFNGRLKLKEVPPITMFETSDIIKVMTPNEIREKVGLMALEDNKMVSSSAVRHSFNDCCKHEFSSEDLSEEMNIVANIIPVFMEYGDDKDGYELKDSCEVDFLGNPVKQNFAEEEPKELYKSILELISQDELIDAETLAKTLKQDLGKIKRALDSLKKKGYIESDKEKTLLTKEGNSVLKDFGSKFEDWEIRYSYEPRPRLEPIIPTTRPFCEALIKSNKLFTREEIETISGRVGYSVWEMRGGWWTAKGTDRSFPFCRHIWQQHLVKKK